MEVVKLQIILSQPNHLTMLISRIQNAMSARHICRKMTGKIEVSRKKTVPVPLLSTTNRKRIPQGSNRSLNGPRPIPATSFRIHSHSTIWRYIVRDKPTSLPKSKHLYHKAQVLPWMRFLVICLSPQTTAGHHLKVRPQFHPSTSSPIHYSLVIWRCMLWIIRSVVK